MREALRLESTQRWLIDSWLTKFWQKSYDAVMKHPKGTVEEAIVNARIRNSGTKSANCGLKFASSHEDRVEAQLAAYVDPTIGCGGKERHRSRVPHIRRALVLYAQFR